MKNMSKRAGQKTLDFFLTKKSKPSYEDSENENKPNQVDKLGQKYTSSRHSSQCEAKENCKNVIPIPSIVQIESSSAQYSGDVDIGHYASNKGSITVADVENFNIIKNAFVPTPQFKFPYSVHCKNQRDMKCFLSTKHFNSFYPGLHISIV